MAQQYRTFEHTADIGLRATGKDRAQAYSLAAQGMFSLITDLRRVRPQQNLKIEIQGSDPDDLLVSWLNELLFYFDSEKMLFREFTALEIDDTSLKAECRGEKVDKQRHILKREIKAATFHRLKIEPLPGGWLVEVILDI